MRHALNGYREEHAKMKLASLKKKMASGEQAACYRQFFHHEHIPASIASCARVSGTCAFVSSF